MLIDSVCCKDHFNESEEKKTQQSWPIDELVFSLKFSMPLDTSFPWLGHTPIT